MNHPQLNDHAAAHFNEADASVNTVIHAPGAELPDSLHGRLQQLVKIYGGIKPVLTVIAATPIMPPTWRAAVAILSQALDAVTSAPEVAGADAGFKAGKDL